MYHGFPTRANGVKLKKEFPPRRREEREAGRHQEEEHRHEKAQKAQTKAML